MINWQAPYSPSPYPYIFSSIAGNETMPLYPGDYVPTDLAIGTGFVVYHHLLESFSINLFA